MTSQHLITNSAQKSTMQQSIDDSSQGTPPKNGALASPRFQTLLRLRQKAELFAAKGPGYHRTYASWRLRRLASRIRPTPALPTGFDLATKLRLDMPSLAQVQTAYAQKNEQALHRALQAHFRTRHEPRFLFNTSELDEIITLVDRLDSTSKESTIRAADQICQNQFSFRKAPPVVFDGAVDWEHCPDGNTDWTWDLNRHTYFESLGRAYLYTGQEKYAAKFCALLRDWLARNPARVDQASWSSVFEVAFRINTWIWALHLFQHAPSLGPETYAALLAGLWLHGDFLDTHLELHAQNNHLLLEAKSLAMVGILFPEFKAAARWRERGLAIFCQEVRDQVCADGVHGERASLYHRIITGELLELLVLADNNNIMLPAEINQTLTKMVEFEVWHTKPDGQASLVGDSAQEDVHLRFCGASGGIAFTRSYHLKEAAPPLGESELWLLGPRRVEEYLRASATPHPPLALGSRTFADGGYFVMRSGHGSESHYALFDCGPFGYQRDATHGHADALSLEIYAHGQSWLVDPGVYSTHLGWKWRRFFRSTHAHNTVVIDDQDQSRLLDGRRVYRPAQATLHQWVSNATFDFVAGSHDGYERLAAPVTHQRQVFFVKPAYWIIVDHLTGEGVHTFDLFFHLPPGLKVQRHPPSLAVCVENDQGATMRIMPVNDTTSSLASLDVIEGATDPVQGWVSLYSGEKNPAPVLRYRRQAAPPTTFCTLLFPQPAEAETGSLKATEVAVTMLAATPAQLRSLTAFRIETDGYLDHLLIAPGTAGMDKAFGGYATDAELLYMRHFKTGGSPVALEMHNGTRLDQRQPSPDDAKL